MEGLKYKWMAPFGEHFRYRFHTGMIAWALHRITGIGIIVFLMIHIWSISHLGQGAESFDEVMALYSTPLFKLGEIGLFGAILYHMLNGVRIIFVDFFGGAKYHKKLFWALMLLGATLFILGAVKMIFYRELFINL